MGVTAPAAGGGRERQALCRLAELWGVEPSHLDGFDRRIHPSAQVLLAVLAELGAPVASMSQVPDAIRARRAELGGRRLPPVSVVWLGGPCVLPRGPALPPHRDVEVRVVTEDGEFREFCARVRPEGIPFPEPLPAGYHQVEVTAGGVTDSTLAVVAPPRAFSGDRVDGEGVDAMNPSLRKGEPGPEEQAGAGRREWGVFLPLHALRTDRDWGTGDLSDLGRLMAWTAARGGHAVGTLPLMASFLDRPLEPSPYAPVSRLFWNDLFLDPTRLPEWHRAPRVRAYAGSVPFREQVEVMRRMAHVDYAGAYRLRSELLDPLAEVWGSEGGPAEPAFHAFVGRSPEAGDYATFRAAVEARGETWSRWPQGWRDQGIPRGEYDPAVRRRHLYAQFRFQEQLDRVVEESGAGLYLDLPLGAHPEGFDTWAHPHLFAAGASMGAPPDGFHREGQDWGLPPIRPGTARAEGHRHFRRVLAQLLPRARYLRIDHVMGLHRLYWVPRGGAAAHGAYVRYPAEELYALLSLESHRHGTVVVGEDLGTVPPEVRREMDRRGFRRMYVVPFELRPPEEGGGMEPVPPGAVASLNTHDMPPFAATWEDQGFRKGLRACLGEEPSRGHRPGPLEVLQGILERLGEGPAGLVLVNLEDLWLEERSQNVPGTPGLENWRRKARLSLEDFAGDGTVAGILEALRRSRSLKPRARVAVPTALLGDGGDPRNRREEKMEREDASPKAAETISEEEAGTWSLLSDDDLHLFNEGTHSRLYRKLGAHLSEDPEYPGTYFAVWAPSAQRVSVVGEFNGWDGEADPLTPRGRSGIWEGFLPGVGKGAAYKYEIHSRYRDHRVQKADPFGFRHEVPPRTASMVWDLDYAWGDEKWMEQRRERNAPEAPISVYEMHLGSWRRDPEDPDRHLSYRELAPELAAYVREMGFTHVQFLPVMEHPFYGSWGYQTTGYFAPTGRYGSPQDFMFLVDHLHQNGIGVLLDWVPSHFPSDEHGLSYFDGTHLFEHADPRQGFHPDWESLIFNYGREEVRAFLLSSALFWLEHYHVDGLRVDAVASMLYLDYSREEGEWIPNRYGGRENLAAIDFLRRLNEEVYGNHPDVQTVAEESTAWPMVSRPTYVGGLGFGMKWDMGWMHDTLLYLSRDPIHRRHHHDELTFRALYAFNENFMLPLSHDEVVHGKGSLLGRMPGDDWQKRANLRVLLAYQFLQPGKKLLFMGGELGQWREWEHDGELDWDLLGDPGHEGIQRLVGDLNRLYRDAPALHRGDFLPEGFEWVGAHDHENSVLAFLRKETEGGEEAPLLAVFNFTPVPRENYRVGVPMEGFWREVLNTDSQDYGGSGRGNLGGRSTDPVPAHDRFHSLTLSLPPLAAVILEGPSR
jgi:alpha-1,4-glucan:alpha-1,4-glucan 6-glycosyltransferase/4-alpha-glucanotransferase